MRRLGLLLALVATFGAAATASAQAPPSPSDIPPDAIALVRDVPVLRAHYDRLIARARRSYQLQKRTFPREGTPEFEMLKHQAVEFLVQRASFEIAARDRALVVTDPDIAARIAQIKREFFGGSEARFRRELRNQGITIEDLRLDVRSQLISERLFTSVTAEITVRDAEVAAYYRSHPNEFRRPASRTVRHILVRTKPLIDRIYAQLRAGAGFAALARRHSLDPGTKRAGGRLTIGRGQTVRPFDRIAFSLRTGALSRPFKTQYGWHVVQALSAVTPGRRQTLAQVRARIRTKLLQQRRNAAMTRFIAELRADLADETVYAPGFEPTRP